LLVGIRAVSNLRVFESYRVQIQIFKQIFVDIFWFMSLLMMLVVLTAIIFGIEYATKEADGKRGTSAAIGKNLAGNVGLFYQFMLGENPYEDEEMIATAWLVYVIFTMLIQVIALNLLVAILSETFTNVMAAMDANHCRTKVDMLHEISGFKCLVKQSDEHKFIHFVRYTSEKLSVYGKDETESQVIKISSQLTDLNSTVATMNENIGEIKSQLSKLVKMNEGGDVKKES